LEKDRVAQVFKQVDRQGFSGTKQARQPPSQRLARFGEPITGETC